MNEKVSHMNIKILVRILLKPENFFFPHIKKYLKTF